MSEVSVLILLLKSKKDQPSCVNPNTKALNPKPQLKPWARNFHFPKPKARAMDPCTAVRASVALASLSFGLAVPGVGCGFRFRVYVFRVHSGSRDFASSHLSPDIGGSNN